GITALKASVRQWQLLFTQTVKPVLCVSDDGAAIDVLDTRPVAVERRITLTGLDAAVYRGAEPPVPLVLLRRRLAGERGVPEAAVGAPTRRLDSLNLVLEVHGRLVTLGVPGDVPQLRGREEAPGGWVVDANLPLHVALERALSRLRGLAPAGAG